jgi:hypothetical protein
MAHPSRIQTKQAVSSRIQEIVDDSCGTFYRFRKLLEKQGRNYLASTVRGWLPPQRRWKEKPKGAAVRPADWDSVKLPDSGTLIEFCDVTSASPNYILLGEGAPLRGQSRDALTLEEDFSAAVKREVLQRIASGALSEQMRAMSPSARRYLRDDIVMSSVVLRSDLAREAIAHYANDALVNSAITVQSLVSGYYTAVVDDARKRIAAIAANGRTADAQHVATNLREVAAELRRQGRSHVRRQVARIVRRTRTERPAGSANGTIAKTSRRGRRSG